MVPHCSTLAWKIPRTAETGRLWSLASLRVGHNWASSLSLFTFMHRRRKWQPTPVFLPGASQGWGSLVGCLSMGSHRVGHDWSNLAATAGRSWWWTERPGVLLSMVLQSRTRLSDWTKLNWKTFSLYFLSLSFLKYLFHCCHEFQAVNLISCSCKIVHLSA